MEWCNFRNDLILLINKTMKLLKHFGKVICGEDNPMVSLKDVMEIVKKEKDTWAEQSIGWKAVESVELALQGK